MINEDPKRYAHGEIECIDAIRAALTPEEYRGFCKGSIIKYVWRERYKGGDADLGKLEDYSRWAREAKKEQTMPANDERRETANRIRLFVMDDVGDMDACDFAHCVAQAIDPKSRMTWLQVAHRIADLIDPEGESDAD